MNPILALGIWITVVVIGMGIALERTIQSLDERLKAVEALLENLIEHEEGKHRT